MRVPSFRFQITPAAISPTSVPSDSSTPIYSLLPSVGSPILMPSGHPAIKFLQAAPQFFRSFHGNPPGANSISRQPSIEGVACYFFSNALVSTRDPFSADVHFPHLCTGGASLCIHLLVFEVFFRSRSCCAFHLDQYLSQLPAQRVALACCHFPYR